MLEKLLTGRHCVRLSPSHLTARTTVDIKTTMITIESKAVTCIQSFSSQRSGYMMFVRASYTGFSNCCSPGWSRFNSLPRH
jgi:hypothetical protein